MKGNLTFNRQTVNPLYKKKRIYKSDSNLMKEAKKARIRYSKERKMREEKRLLSRRAHLLKMERELMVE